VASKRRTSRRCIKGAPIPWTKVYVTQFGRSSWADIAYCADPLIPLDDKASCGTERISALGSLAEENGSKYRHPENNKFCSKGFRQMHWCGHGPGEESQAVFRLAI